MKRSSRHLFLTWLLLALFIYNSVGCYATFFAWKLSMTERLEELASTLSDDKLVLIKLSPGEKNENEICVNGKQFDVVRTRVINGQVYVYCMRDIEEETLAAGLSDNYAFNKAHNDLGKAIKALQKNTVEKYTSSINEHPEPFLSIMANHYLSRVKDAYDFSLVKDSPPPKS